MAPQFRLAPALLAAGIGLLTACRSVPETTRIPVPGGPTVLNGRYSGTLTEGLGFADAVLSPDGARLYVAARASQHTTLLELDAATGQELRRADVAVESPEDIAWRSDGRLVIAAWAGSGVVDPSGLRLLRTLPEANLVSTDGERLLETPRGDSRTYRSSSTRDGSVLAEVVVPLGEPLYRPTRDGRWLTGPAGQLDLQSGARVAFTGQRPDPCKRDAAGLTVLAADTTPSGPVLLMDDGTVEWRTPDGRLRAAHSLGLQCGSGAGPLYNAGMAAVGESVLYAGGYSLGSQNRDRIGRISPDGAAVVGVDLSADQVGSWGLFRGLFAYGTESRPLDAGSAGADPSLQAWNAWKQGYAPVRLPLTLSARASYVNAQTYQINGELQGPSGTLTLRGTGKGTPGTPGTVFTQALCSAPPFGPNCPTTGWEGDLYDGAAKVGQVYSRALDPNTAGPPRRVHLGSIGFRWNGEYRSFGFELTPH